MQIFCGFFDFAGEARRGIDGEALGTTLLHGATAGMSLIHIILTTVQTIATSTIPPPFPCRHKAFPAALNLPFLPPNKKTFFPANSFLLLYLKINYMHKTVLSLVFFLLIFKGNAQQVSLLFAGDAMQHQTQLDNALRNGRYDYSSYFEQLTGLISAADIAVVNLETTLGGKPYRGYPMFCSPDEYAKALKEAGFDIFLTANNHILDRYSKGLHRTLHVLDSLKIRHTGVFRNPEEREQVYPLMIEKNGILFAFLNYTYGTNGLQPAPPDVVNYIDLDRMREDIRRAQNQLADVIIANMHWGAEYQLKPNGEQEKLARWLIDEGVDIVMGGHPHVVQPAQVTRDEEGEISHLVVYSLGNLISGMTAVNTDGGQLIRVVVEKDREGTRIVSCGYRLVYVDKKRNGDKVDYQLVPVTEPSGEIALPNMRRFATNARAALDANNVGVAED
jgi:poly-gamma-glutamate synthesis protein (capsule biosynthesis protein)